MSEKVLSTVERLSQQNPYRGAARLLDPPRPDESSIPRHLSSVEQLPHIQQLLDTLRYNHLPSTFFSLEKHRSLQSILFTAKEILSEALPIRCLEATFVGLLLTQSLRDMDRIPLSFKSSANGQFYRHIVLVTRTRAAPVMYGALGLSRKSTLMYKPHKFRSLFELVMNYKAEYEALGHELVDVKLGLPVTHDDHSRWDPCWRFVALRLDRFCTTAAVSTERSGSPSSPKSGRRGSSATACTSASVSPGASPAKVCETARPSVSPTKKDVGRVSYERVVNWGGEAEPHIGPLVHPNEPIHEESGASPPFCDPLVSAVRAVDADGALNLAAAPASNAEPDDSYRPLAQFLSNYSRLLPVMAEQFYKGIGTIDQANRWMKLCYMDLDLTERDAKVENQRRVQFVSQSQSPFGPEGMRAASTQPLKPPKKKTTKKGGGGASPSTVRTTRSVKSGRRGGAAATAAVGDEDVARPLVLTDQAASADISELTDAVSPHRGGAIGLPLFHGAATPPTTASTPQGMRVPVWHEALLANSERDGAGEGVSPRVPHTARTAASSHMFDSLIIDAGSMGSASPCMLDQDQFTSPQEAPIEEDGIPVEQMPGAPRNRDKMSRESSCHSVVAASSAESILFSSPGSMSSVGAVKNQ